jgi:acetyl-CoA carboxylase, biotin carboxylase subunit
MFKKILIANRGEIAVRIIRGCREMGILTVAVYSEADRESLHVQEADQAVLIGPAPASESYLNIDAVLKAAEKTGAEAVHPGYGFLAENPVFSRRCREAGLVFIGPNPKSMELVGDKVRARTVMEKAGVPIIPGMKGIKKNLDEYEDAAEEIGYPLMIKASAGGGGKGMRIIRSPENLRAGLEAGRREALSAFGDESVYLEKYIEEPRHVEFQVLADNHGNMIHLFERECSIQRRHQKIIEESPSTVMDPELREVMGRTACRVAAESGYNNAGTVEFLLDKNKNFYFLEVNARLQVEHPVTELVTGVDLVHHQIQIAAGGKLQLRQEDLTQRGHAIECRVYAEDPINQFLPSSGDVLYYHEPSGPGVRTDGGIQSGSEVPIHYDPILAKLIVWAEDRNQACRRTRLALDDYVVLGIKTNINFLKAVIKHESFIKGDTNTGFIETYMKDWTGAGAKMENRELALFAAAFLCEQKRGLVLQPGESAHEMPSPWTLLGGWRLGEGD